MSKLSIILGCILSLTACNKQTAVVAPVHQELAGEAKCEQVYQHIVWLAYQQFVDPTHVISLEQRNQAVLDVDSEFRNQGIADRFLRACNMYMTVPQSECAMNAATLNDITVCMNKENDHVK